MKKFAIRISMNNRYYVRRISAINSDIAVTVLKEKMPGQEFHVVSVQELQQKKSAPKFYVAYGSNLHLTQMSHRCPDAKVYGSGVIKNYRLAFYGVASILPETGTDVPVGVWMISDRDEENLDRYEGFPHLYRKENIEVVMESGETITAMVYIMNRDGEESHPAESYYRTIYSGYQAFNLNTEYLEDSVKKFSDSIFCRW